MANYDEFSDPNSAIARIIQQMQNAATRSNPDAISQEQLQGDLQPGGAQPSQGGMEAVRRMGVPPPLQEDTTNDPYAAGSPEAFIRALLGGMGRR